MSQPDIICEQLNQLGESPLWHPVENRLYWLDCLDTTLFCYNPLSENISTCPISEYVGAIAYRSQGGLIATTTTGIALLDPNNGSLSPLVNLLSKNSHLRMNDAKCDRQGRFWAGSASNDINKQEGALFCLDSTQQCTLKQKGFMISNGIGFSPDNTIMYHNDSVAKMTYCYDYDIKTGNIDNQRIFWDASQYGEPDGLTIDTNGGIWIAIWEGSAVVRLLKNGTIDKIIDLPTPRPTSLIFGGDNLSTLYITSCNHVSFRGESARPAPAGALFGLKTTYQGIAETGYSN